MSVLSILIRAALCLIFVFLPLQQMDQWFYDHFFRLRGTRHESSPFVLVRVSDAKLLQLMESDDVLKRKDEFRVEHTLHSVWFQHFYESLLTKILADKPKLVIFTSFFEWIEPISHPSRETVGILNQPNILFSSVVNDENKLVPPSVRLARWENYGFNNIFPDPDNRVRKSHLIYSSEVSLSVRAYKTLNKEPITRDLIAPFRINFRGPAGSYPSYDGWEVHEAPPTKGLFTDKIVLIGPEGSPLSDLNTPFGKMSRLEIHANSINTFLRDKEIKIAPHWVNILLSLISVATAIFIILYFPLKVAWAVLPFFAGALLLVTLFFFSALSLWAGVANPIFCIFGSFLVMLGYKLARQEEKQWRVVQESQYLKEMDQFKNNFISLFSHDLKTPIAKIKAVLDRVLTEKSAALPPDVLEALKTIDKTNSELARFISDILKVTKMESMKIDPRKEVIDLNRLVEAAVQRLKFLADEKNVRLVSDLEPLFSLEGDQQLIQEIIFNLLENAIKYSPSEKSVVLRTREEGELVKVSVVDEGMGIAADELPRVTGKFYRGRNASESTKGSGLGLYLSKYFVELHGGTLTIESALGRGTTVTFTLPTSEK
jgi:two-component system, OmpR family, phosphate regulon sensor histidine kinase PhoR